jgi:cytochrome c-type biogenesis protein
MLDWVHRVFDNPEYGLLILPAAILLGFAASVGSCCNVAVVGAITGFSGASQNTRRSTIIVTGLSFMIGTILALAALGAVSGFVSQVAGTAMGKYWKLFAGLAAVFFGLVSFGLAPFKLPSLGSSFKPGVPQSLIGATVFGLTVGGGASACSIGCNPALATALGLSVVKGQTIWGMVILAFFAIGYSLPMTLALIGLSMGKAAFLRSQKASTAIKYFGGVILIVVGFYFLATI